MTLIRTSILSAISTVITIFSGLIINKFIALYIGPGGLAMIGNFQNFIQIIKTLGSGAISTGVVKYTSEYSSDRQNLEKFLSTSFTYILWTTLLLSIILFLFGTPITNVIFGTEKYQNIIYLMGATVGMFFFNQFLFSILNGLKQIKLYTILSIMNSIVSLFITAVLIYKLQLLGILIAIVLNQSLTFVLSVALVLKFKILTFKLKLFYRDSINTKRLASFYLMGIVSGISVPVSHLILRDYIATDISMESAGYWEAMWRISTVYLLLVTTTFSVYYIPRLSELQSIKKLRQEIFHGYIMILPIVVFSAFCIYLLKDEIVHLLFTHEFQEMKTLFFYVLLGDIVKIASWLLSTLLVAKAMTKIFIWTELLFKIPFLALTIGLSNIYGLEGVALGYFINYLLYLSVMLYIFKDLIFKAKFNFSKYTI